MNPNQRNTDSLPVLLSLSQGNRRLAQACKLSPQGWRQHEVDYYEYVSSIPRHTANYFDQAIGTPTKPKSPPKPLHAFGEPFLPRIRRVLRRDSVRRAERSGWSNGETFAHPQWVDNSPTASTLHKRYRIACTWSRLALYLIYAIGGGMIGAYLIAWAIDRFA